MKQFLRSGDLFIWLTGAFLGICLLMISGLLLLIAVQGIAHFHPRQVHLLEYRDTDGNNLLALGQIYSSEYIPPDVLQQEELKSSLQQDARRYLVRVGNRDVFGEDFKWILGPTVTLDTLLANAVVLEREEYGNAYGVMTALRAPHEQHFETELDAWRAFERFHPIVRSLVHEIRSIEKEQMGEMNDAIRSLRLELRSMEYKLEGGRIDLSQFQEAQRRIDAEIAEFESVLDRYQDRIDSLRMHLTEYEISLRVYAPHGEETMDIPLASIVRAYKPNLMSGSEVLAFYGEKIWEFISDDPREANAEGGVFPAIFGTVLMVLLMSLAAVPFGVLAALYLREYARQGLLLRIVRIAVNNLAGVPSIVFGMFGLGFFVYFVGGGIDRMFFPERLPNPTYGTGGILWASLTLALLTVPVVIVATEEALAAIPRGIREGSYALGATKWDTIRRIVLPSATPGIMTGTILAMARGAGEVAPLMITGVVKLATEMPFDSSFPFFHLDRKFMHLGFHIYDVGFQTSNVEANIGMVYTTAFLLIIIVLLLNLTAITLRARLRRKYRLVGF
jgi:phosphate transport system permease protein